MKSAAVVGLLALMSWSAQAAHNVPGLRAGVAASFVTFNWDKPDEAIEDNSIGVKLHAQYQFNNWLGIEGAYHATGDFEDHVSTCMIGTDVFDGELDLKFDGFSGQAIFYIPSPSDEIQLYAKAGYYDFNNDLEVNDSTIDSSYESGLVVGAGAGIEIAEHVGLRVDLDWFDAELGDLWGVNIGVEYFFGGAKEEAPVVAAPPPPAPEPAPEPPPPPPPDSDGDGVVDAGDDCPDTPAGAKVDASGCEEQIVLRGVTFENNSARLTPQSTLILDSVAEILKQRPRYKVEIRGHTDSVGAEEANLDLSQRRANNVMDYLIDQGVEASKLTAVGYGETQPIASNDDADGRSQNRRVSLEFQAP